MKEKYGSFDDIIKTAKEIEQNTYDIGKDDSLFSVSRRNKKRIELTCSKKNESCNFSIIYTLYRCSRLQQLHTCSFSSLKRSEAQLEDSCLVTTVPTPLTATTTSSSISSIPIVVVKNGSLGTQRSMLLQQPSPPSTADDGDCSIDTSSGDLTTSSLGSSASPVQETNALEVGSCTCNSNHDSADLNTLVGGPVQETIAINCATVDFYQKYVDLIIISMYTNNTCGKVEEKAHLSRRLKELLVTQFGFQFFKEAFNGYHSTERDNIIFQLQMINDIRKASEESYTKWQNRLVDASPSPKKKQKVEYCNGYPEKYYDVDDDDEEEIIFRDK